MRQQFRMLGIRSWMCESWFSNGRVLNAFFFYLPKRLSFSFIHSYYSILIAILKQYFLNCRSVFHAAMSCTATSQYQQINQMPLYRVNVHRAKIKPYLPSIQVSANYSETQIWLLSVSCCFLETWIVASARPWNIQAPYNRKLLLSTSSAFTFHNKFRIRDNLMLWFSSNWNAVLTKIIPNSDNISHKI